VARAHNDRIAYVRAESAMLRLLRCDQMQGYLIRKPVPMEELTPLLRQ
jgi:EAL domain-containing protein (putative c-di-GMP-specific phosphodiesterase class I)